MKVSLYGKIVEVQRMQDSTHFLMDGRAFHVGELRSKKLSSDLYQWLSGLMSDTEIESKTY